jgi:hypothetical protein
MMDEYMRQRELENIWRDRSLMFADSPSSL